MQLAERASRPQVLRVAILDADLNGPSQARMAGLGRCRSFPARTGSSCRARRPASAWSRWASLVPESEALDFESVARGDSYVWRATREFSLLGDLLAGVAWGALDFLLVDLPPGAERTFQYAEFLGPAAALVLVTIPSDVSRGVVARSLAALRKTPNRILGYVENMSGYSCGGCDTVRPLFRGVGRDRPRHPLSRLGAVRSRSRRRVRSRRSRCADDPSSPTRQAIREVAAGDPPSHGGDMKFLCVLCDQPMKLVEVAPPDRGSLSVVYECPECAHRIAMLTNPLETQMVTSLGVADRPERREDRIEVPVLGDDPGHVGAASARRRRCRGRPRRSSGCERSRIRPSDGAGRHRELRPRAGPSRGRRAGARAGQGASSECRDAFSSRRADRKRHNRERRRSPARTSSPGI